MVKNIPVILDIRFPEEKARGAANKYFIWLIQCN